MYKPVEEYSAFGGKITKLYYCAAEAARELGISYYQMIKIIQEGKRYKYKCYRWYYKEKKTSAVTVNYIEQKHDNKIINRFKSISEASKILGIGRNVISRLIKNGQIDQWGCTWHNLRKINENLQ